MKKPRSLVVFLFILLLVACSQVQAQPNSAPTTTSEPLVSQPTGVSQATLTPIPTDVPVSTFTIVPTLIPTATLNPLDEKLEYEYASMNGEWKPNRRLSDDFSDLDGVYKAMQDYGYPTNQIGPNFWEASESSPELLVEIDATRITTITLLVDVAHGDYEGIAGYVLVFDGPDPEHYEVCQEFALTVGGNVSEWQVGDVSQYPYLVTTVNNPLTQEIYSGLSTGQKEAVIHQTSFTFNNCNGVRYIRIVDNPGDIILLRVYGVLVWYITG